MGDRGPVKVFFQVQKPRHTMVITAWQKMARLQFKLAESLVVPSKCFVFLSEIQNEHIARSWRFAPRFRRQCDRLGFSGKKRL